MLGFDSTGNLTEIPINSAFGNGTVQGTDALRDVRMTATDEQVVTNPDPRGEDSIDLQGYRDLATEVASGKNSVLVGGYSNTASGENSGVITGGKNIASGGKSFVAGGFTNTASSRSSVVIGGENNTASSRSSVVIGGENNTASTAVKSAVVGGSANTATGLASFIGGGQNNEALAQYAGVLGGTGNVASGNNSTVIGGYGNNASGDRGVVMVGASATASGDDTLAVGGNVTASHRGAKMFGGYQTVIPFASKAINEFGVQCDNLRLEVGTPAVGQVLTCNNTDGSSGWSAPAKVVYTVATLPASPAQGDVAMVTDATATTFHSVVAGTGSNIVPVFNDGTNWRIG